MMNLAMLAQYAQDEGNGGLTFFFLLLIVFYIALIVAVLAGMWRTFEKAGQPGWASIIPIYNLYIMLVICGKPWWWMLIMIFAGIIPFAGPIVVLVFTIMLYVALSKSFGHGVGFALGLIFLSPIFIMILGFGSSRYVGPGGGAAPSLPAEEPPLPPPDIR